MRALAGDLTAAAASRYDAAVAVAGYLQKGYTYSLKTRVPPSSADFTDDFLFGTRQGYCVHFATAMTVLLRSSGIPARYVQGYGPGTAVPGSVPQRYSVTSGDAHAWVEVYFPGAGWVPFDPTPSAAAAAALGAAATDPAAASAPPDTRRSAALHADALTAALPQAGGPDTAPLALAALVLAAAIRRRRSLALLPAVRRAGRLGRERQLRAAALAWHGLAARYGPPLPGVTAREYADSWLSRTGGCAPPSGVCTPVGDPGVWRRRRRRAFSGRALRWRRRALSVGGLRWRRHAFSGVGPHRRRLTFVALCADVARLALVTPEPSNAADTIDAAAFMARCLMITFHLT